MSSSKVAWYDRGSGPLRDVAILLHPPYTLWHLSYVVIGAALAPGMNWAILGWTLLAFFLAMGIGAHCLDELNGRPLRTKIPDLVLIAAASLSIGGAVIIGTIIGVRETIWVSPFVIFGGFIAFAYNLEWFRGFFHLDPWFAFAWGAFPALTAYVAQTHTMTVEVGLVALACFFYSWAQRALSKQVRYFRRQVRPFVCKYAEMGDNEPWRDLAKEEIVGPPEQALKLMTRAIIIGAAGLALTQI